MKTAGLNSDRNPKRQRGTSEKAQQHSTLTDVSDDGPHRGRRRLVIALVSIGIIWGIVLPALARLPMIAAHIQHLDAKHVDASALYYTDLDPRVFKPTTLRDQSQQ